MTLHERIEALVGWKAGEAKTFSLPSLREIVRMQPESKAKAVLLDDIQRAIRTGSIITSG